MNIGIAQTDVRLGALEDNLEKHLEWVKKALDRGVDLLVFPELSLTGYRLLHLTGRVAVRPAGSALLKPLLEASRKLALIVGLVEEDGHGTLYNSSLLLSDGRIAHCHRKLYLPTYGIFQEGRFFGAGRTLSVAPWHDNVLGLLICEDLWHPHLARSLAMAGAKVVIVSSASPGRIGPGATPESQEVWETLIRSTAIVNTCWVVYANRVGWEEGSFYTGGSLVARPGGDVHCRAPFVQEYLLTADIDLREVDRLRWRLPLVRSQRSDIEGAP
ncbi:MAG: carbon-nitrogen hydrolase [Acidobacteriota bacterium]|nr:carbon-nitrogen hydrolase [Acidobacteriota bacterium]